MIEWSTFLKEKLKLYKKSSLSRDELKLLEKAWLKEYNILKEHSLAKKNKPKPKPKPKKEKKPKKENSPLTLVPIDWRLQLDAKMIQPPENCYITTSLKKTKWPACVSTSQLEPKEHQVRIVEHMLSPKNRGLLVVHSVGAGKTLAAVITVMCFLAQGLRGYIVTPKSLVHNFQKEIQAYLGGQNLSDEYQDRLKFMTLQKFGRQLAQDPHLLKDHFFILDEAHNVVNTTSVTGRRVVKAAQEAEKVLLLTATPMRNKVSDINSLISMIEPKIIKNMGRVYHPKHFQNLISYYHCPKQEGYPSVTQHIEPLLMTGPYLQDYLKLESGELKKLNVDIHDLFGNVQDLYAFYNGLRRAVNNLRADQSPKIDWIIKLVQKTCMKNARQKILIYSTWLKAGADLVKSRLNHLNVKWGEINGQQSQIERKEIVELYNQNHIQVLMISKAGGEGLDLKGTRHVVILEPAWNSAVEHQAEGRAIRYLSHVHLPEKERHVDVWHLEATKPNYNDSQRFYRVYNESDGLPSVDTLLMRLQISKNNAMNRYLHKLEPYIIENKK